MVCSHANHIAKTGVYSTSISDHDLTGLCRKMNCKRSGPRRILTRNYKNYNPKKFKNDVNNIPWGDIINHDLNSVWNSFKDFLMQCANKHAPLMERSVSGRDCPLLTPDIKPQMKERDFYLCKARKHWTENDCSKYRQLRKTLTAMIRKSKANYNRKMFKNDIKSAKEFWSKKEQIYPSEKE